MVASVSEPTPAIAVVGGGISGLAAAHALDRSGCRVVLFEASPRLGGVVKSGQVEDVVVEEGPDAFVSGDGVFGLCEAVGLGDDLVSPAVFGGLIWTGRGLKALPSGVVLGLPAAPWAAVRAGLLSPLGGLRACADLILPGPLQGPDVQVGRLIRHRFGGEVLERLVDPLLAGRRAGDPYGMSLAAAEPQIDALARNHRSIILGLRGARRAGAAGGPPTFLAPAGGMERLVGCIERAFDGVEVRRGAKVESVRRSEDGTYVVRTPETEPQGFEGVVVALPAHAAATSIAGLSSDATGWLMEIEYASTAVVTFVYPPGSGAPPGGGSGFLVPSYRGKVTAACTWYSAKWPAATPRDGALVLRAFVGRAGREPALSWDDDRLAAAIDMELRNALTLDGAPRSCKVTRWERSLPQYAAGHTALVERIESALSREHPGVALCGAGYKGSGIPDCIRSAEEAASKVLQAVTSRALL